jgi:hypothetical protein
MYWTLEEAEFSINKQLQPHPSLANVLDEDDRSLLTYACLYVCTTPRLLTIHLMNVLVGPTRSCSTSGAVDG